MKTRMNIANCRSRVMTLLVMLLMGMTAQSAVVILKAGEGTGADISISSSEPANMAESWQSAAKGQFWQEDGKLFFKIPDCPFSAPGDNYKFAGWSIDGGETVGPLPGSAFPVPEEWTLTACWEEKRDAKLLSLTASEGTLVQQSNPDLGFSPDVYDYEVNIIYTGSPVAVTLTAVPRDPNAQIYYDGVGECPILGHNSNCIIKVINGSSEECYIVFITTYFSINLTTEGEGTAKAYDKFAGDEGYSGRNNKSFVLKATPATGWRFKEWQLVSGGGRLWYPTSQTGAEYVMGDDNAEIKAVFEEIPPSSVSLAGNADNSTVISRYNGKSLDVTLDGHTLYTGGDWQTLCLPFSLSSLAGTPLEGFTVKELDTETENDGHKTGTEDGTLYLNFKDATGITAGKPYIVRKDVAADLVISSAADWNTFAQNVSDGTSYEGKMVELGADISVSTMAGGIFKGTFDGNGHTINVDLSGGGGGLALFYTIEDATIQNLIVTGTVTSSNHRPATFTSIVNGSCAIRNCWSSVDVVSTRTGGWVDGGAMVARVSAGATLNMTDCLFSGTFTYNGGTSGGGMVGFTQPSSSVNFNFPDAIANLTNCLFCPSELTLTASEYNPRVFVSGDVRGNLTNCYYNSVTKDSSLPKEGIDGSGMTTAALATALGAGWEVSGDNVLPVICHDIKNPTFVGVTLNATPPATVTSADGTVSLKGSYAPVSLAANDLSKLYLDSGNTLRYPSKAHDISAFCARFLLNALSLGDVNGDRDISATDVTLLVNYILESNDEGVVIENANVNGDMEISVTDVTALVNKILDSSNYSIDSVVVNGADGITLGSEEGVSN